MKHLRKDWDGIQDTHQKSGVPGTSCSSIEDDEPVFLLRAKDPAAAATVTYWADYVLTQGGDPALVKRVREWAVEMDIWRMENNPEAKVADTPEGLLK